MAGRARTGTACRTCVVTALASLAAAGHASASVADEVLLLTGGKRAKFVWVSGWDWHFKTLDTDDGTVREILHKGTSGARYDRPLITADGLKIVYLNKDTTPPHTHVANFDGTGDSVLLTDTWTSDVWRDPGTGKDYIIGVVGFVGSEGTVEGDVYKIDMENTLNRTLIWDKTPAYVPSGHPEKVEWGWLTMSPDGEYICSAFPFMGGCGTGRIKTVDPAQTNRFRLEPVTGQQGCWTCIVPDDTHRFMTLDYAHDTWWYDTDDFWVDALHIQFASVPDPEGDNTNKNVYYAQFTNDPLFMVCTENYDDTNFKHAYMAKLSADLRSITDWVVLCDQSQPTWNIDGWVDPGTSPGPDPVMSFSPVSLGFSAEVGGTSPGAKTITVTNSAGGTLDTVTWTGEPSWLTITGSGSGNTQHLANSIDITGLSADTYAAAVTVTCANAVRTTKQYTVTLTVSAAGRDPDDPTGTTPGLAVAYYKTTGGSLPNFFSLNSYSRKLVSDISYAATAGELATSGRTDSVGAVFEGYVQVPSLGDYTFFTESDDGSALYIGAQKVVDNDGTHGMQERSGSIVLKAGWHELKVEYVEGTDSAGLIMRYSGPGIARQVVPASALCTNGKVLLITSPNGGEVWYVGTTQRIRWDSLNVDIVEIYYSTNNGDSWTELTPALKTGDPGWASYPWTIPDTPSTQCVVSVSEYCYPEISTYSVETFEIRGFVDSDSDGMDDSWEFGNFGDLSHGGGGDGDDDGLTDLEEYQNATDPDDPDSDGDGFTDGQEVKAGTDPNSQYSYPPPGASTVGCAPAVGAGVGAAGAGFLALLIALGALSRRAAARREP